MSHIKNVLKGYEKLRSAYDDTLTLIELAIEMDDESVYEEAKKGYDFVMADLETQKLSTLLTGEYDENNAILTFHAVSYTHLVKALGTLAICMPP